MLKIAGTGWLIGNVAVFGQLVADGQLTTDWLTAGSQAVVTGLLLLTWKSIFIDQKWVPKKDAEHDDAMRGEVKRIADHLGVGHGHETE